MKSMKNQLIASILMLSSTFTYISCEKDINTTPPEAKRESGQVKAEGTMLTFLNGFVTLDLQPGTVANPADIKVSELLDNECDYMDDCNWILKMISIESKDIFDKSINVFLSYDQDLVNSQLAINQNAPTIYYWQNREDFDTHSRRETIFFETDPKNKILKFEIKKAGLYAIGLNI